MSKKKRDILKRLKPEEKRLLDQIRQEVEAQGFKEEVIKGISSPMVAAALLSDIIKSGLDDPQIITFLQGIRDKFPKDKHVRKEIKRLAFRLEKRGVNTKALITEEEDDFTPIYVEVEEQQAYVSPIIGGSWQRFMFFGLYLYATRGIDAIIIFVSEESGIDKFMIFRDISKKRFNSLKNNIKNWLPYTNAKIIKVDLPYAKAILKQAYDKGVADTDEVLAIERLMKWMNENVPDLDEHPLYSLITEPEISKLNGITQSEIEELFSHELMMDWLVIEEDDVNNMIQEIKALEEGPLVLSDSLKRDKIREIRDKYRNIIFKPEIFKSRFEDMAYYFFVLGNKRMGDLCLKAISAFTDEDRGYELMTDYMLNKVISNKIKEEEEEDSNISIYQL